MTRAVRWSSLGLILFVTGCFWVGATAEDAPGPDGVDPDLRLPRLRTARATDEGGRGLYLVEQLATRWGSRPTADGKAVWFEIPLDAKDGA